MKPLLAPVREDGNPSIIGPLVAPSSGVAGNSGLATGSEDLGDPKSLSRRWHGGFERPENAKPALAESGCKARERLATPGSGRFG